jgi:hypothetical protein
MPNWFATFALLAWLLVAAVMFSVRPPARAIALTLLGGLLLLPVGLRLKIPMIPAFDKNSIPNLAIAIGCLFLVKRPFKFPNGFGLVEVLLVILFAGIFITSELNGDSIEIGDRLVQSVGGYDAFSAALEQFIFMLPFFLGRRVFRNHTDIEYIFRVTVIAGLCYSVPMLFEVRMSPQLHSWVYGYFPSDFVQNIRDGGFRPVVFLGHGLMVAFFTMTTVVAAAAFWRIKSRLAGMPAFGSVIYLSVILIFCKSLGSLIYGVVLLPLVKWTKPLTQLRVAVLLATVSLTYPLLRTEGLVPVNSMIDIASMVNAERADSLAVRFGQEAMLLEHASSRIFFGWGRYGRSRVYNDYGKDISLTDGKWVTTIGQWGIFGFISMFGLLALPIFRAIGSLRFAESEREKTFLAALGLLCAVSLFDLLPNDTLTPWTWFLAGSLLGRAEALRSLSKARNRAPLANNGAPYVSSSGVVKSY